MKSRGVAKIMFQNKNSCVLQDRIGLNNISPYFLYTLLATVILNLNKYGSKAKSRRINIEIS